MGAFTSAMIIAPDLLLDLSPPLVFFHASFIMPMQVVQERDPLSQSWSSTEVASDTSKTGDSTLTFELSSKNEQVSSASTSMAQSNLDKDDEDLSTDEISMSVRLLS